MALGLVALLASVTSGCGGGDKPGATRAAGGAGSSRTTLATHDPDRWDRSLAPGSTVIVHGNVVTVGRGEKPNESGVDHFKSIHDLAVDRNGSVLVVDIDLRRVVRATRSGEFEVVDGTEAEPSPRRVAVGPEGTIWISGEKGLHRLDAGVLTTVVPYRSNQDPEGERLAGTPVASLNVPSADALAIDGQSRPLLAWHNAIIRLEPDGTVTHIAGGGTDKAGEGGPATAAPFKSIDAVRVEPDGTIVVLDQQARLVRAIAPDGTIVTWGGVVPKVIDLEVGPFDGMPQGLALAADGSAIVTVPEDQAIYRVTKDKVTAIASTVSLSGPVATLPDGSVVVADILNGLTRVGI